MSLFYELGRKAGAGLVKAKWMLSALAGTEAERILAEQQYGRVMVEQYRTTTPVDADDAVAAMLGDLGGRLGRCLTDRRLQFEFSCDRVDHLNALALPGGYVFVSRPLVDLCGPDRDKMAFVLAHEMAHVVRGHASKRFVTSVVMSLATTHGFVGGPVRQAIGGLLSTLVQRGYSRDNELEADQFAVRLPRAAGFDASAGARLFERMKQERPEPSKWGEYFSTHPSFDERIERILRT